MLLFFVLVRVCLFGVEMLDDWTLIFLAYSHLMINMFKKICDDMSNVMYVNPPLFKCHSQKNSFLGNFALRVNKYAMLCEN